MKPLWMLCLVLALASDGWAGSGPLERPSVLRPWGIAFSGAPTSRGRGRWWIAPAASSPVHERCA